MALIWADRVLETATTTGTGNFTLAGAVTGYRAFSSVCATSDTLYYAIEAVDGNNIPSGDWETGLGTYSGANTLTRTTVLASSNSNAAVSFAAGTKRVMLTLNTAQAKHITLGPVWTSLTFGSSSTIFGAAGRFASTETFTLAAGQVLQVEALIYNDAGTSNGSALGTYKPSTGDGFYLLNKDDGDLKMFKYISSVETAITALGSNNTNDFSAIMRWTCQLSIDSTSNALFWGTIDGVRMLTSNSHGISSANLTGTVSPWIFSTDMTKTYARARVLG